ncbi:MAG: metallophosphoesterase [Clostridia bacterium]|nr:metallophosphoesterase [Clostridia bacterium]
MRKTGLLIVLIILLVSFMGCNLKNKQSEKEEISPEKLVDFVVEVAEGKDITVLQLTDTQIIDSSQSRTSNRLSGSLPDYWARDKMEDRCFKYLRDLIERSSPDLIILTGDVVYGEFDDDGSALTAFIEFMDGFGIPWAPVFGNHEAESRMGVNWQCDQYAIAKHCLFRQRVLTGNGNYTVGIVQGGELKRVFFMMDSNGYSNLTSDESFSNGHTSMGLGFESDQVDWMESEVGKIKEKSPKTHFSICFHIPIKAFINAWSGYGYVNTAEQELINFDEVGKPGEFGIVNSNVSAWDTSMRTWKAIKQSGFDSVFVGHEHQISASVIYEGVRLQFGQKSSTYDSLNYVASSGEIVRSYSDVGTPLVGGTVIPLGEGGELKTPYIMLCEE